MNYCEILEDAETIAVVGISSNPDKTSRNIARYLHSVGYNVIGINPNCSEPELESIKIYNKLQDVPGKIDIVDVFRKSDDVDDLIEDILAVKPKTLWLQLGIVNEDAMQAARNAGIKAIQDRCIYIEHKNCGFA